MAHNDETPTVASTLAKALFLFRLILGGCAATVALFNLAGVPMLERRAMNPVIGWIAAGVALLCFVGSIERLDKE